MNSLISLQLCRAQAARAQRKADTYRRRMAALGQPVFPAEPNPTYAPGFDYPLQGMYQDPYAAAQGYRGAAYSQAPVYQEVPASLYAADMPLAGALQWEMPQVHSQSGAGRGAPYALCPQS